MRRFSARIRSRTAVFFTHTLLAIILGGTALIVAGCTEETAIGALLNRPRVALVGLEKVQTDRQARIRTVVRNNGDGTAYNTSIEIRLERAGTIIETTYGGMGRVEPGQRVQNEITLFDVETHDDYDSMQCSLSWRNARNRVFTGNC